MKKHILFCLVFVILMLSMVLASCNVNTTPHEHSFDEIITPPTYTNEGYTTHTCECGYSYKDEYISVPSPSQGLEYELNEDGVSYSVKGIGTCDDTFVVIPSVYENLPVTGISKYAFCEQVLVENIVIPDSVTNIGHYAFKDCKSLVSIAIPDSVVDFGGSVFYGCTNVKSIFLGSGITKITNHTYVDTVIVPGVSIQIQGQWTSFPFYDCVSLETVKFSESISEIGAYVFSDCDSLKNILVDENNEHYRSIDGNLYSKKGETLVCYAKGKNETSFAVPDFVMYIGEYAFLNCETLTNVSIGNSTKIIGKEAFTNCTSLTSITIPTSVICIEKYALSNCTSLTNINWEGTVLEWKGIDFKEHWSFLTGEFTIYCTDGTIARDGTVTYK